MEFKSIKNYKKLDVPTKKESKNKLLSFLLENKTLTVSSIIIFLINNKSFAIIDTFTAGIAPVEIPGGLSYEPTPFEIFMDIAPITIVFSIITFIIFNIISNKKYAKILNHEEEEIFKKKKRKNLIIISVSILLLWIITSFVIFKLGY